MCIQSTFGFYVCTYMCRHFIYSSSVPQTTSCPQTERARAHTFDESETYASSMNSARTSNPIKYHFTAIEMDHFNASSQNINGNFISSIINWILCSAIKCIIAIYLMATMKNLQNLFTFGKIFVSKQEKKKNQNQKQIF